MWFIRQISKVCVAHISAGCAYPLFVGHVSGRVLAVRVRVRAGVPRVRTRALAAHAHAVSDMCVCARAALLATASVDGLIVLWDLNKSVPAPAPRQILYHSSSFKSFHTFYS